MSRSIMQAHFALDGDRSSTLIATHQQSPVEDFPLHVLRLPEIVATGSVRTASGTYHAALMVAL